MMIVLDPIEQRSRRRFVRRVYHSLGPNHVWHIDGYDKLKPYGLAISGCIDGYSRKVMWSFCGASNNDPYIMNTVNLESYQSFFALTVALKNGTMAAIHCSLISTHTDDLAGASSHMYGSSITNQIIENWWSYFRKQRYSPHNHDILGLYLTFLAELYSWKC